MHIPARFIKEACASEPVLWLMRVKVARNYSYVASTTINNAAASQLLTINQLRTKQKYISHGFIAILSSLSLAYFTIP